MVKVLRPGFYSTIQDLGRLGAMHYGVPQSGVMDRYATGLANMLLGNDETAAVLEMTMTGCVLAFETDTYICLSGADMSPKLNDQIIACHKPIKIMAGDVLSFGKLQTGFRCYLAVSGGFKTKAVLASRSMYQGITKQAVLLKDDELPIAASKTLNTVHHAGIRLNSKYLLDPLLPVYKGPEFELLTPEQQSLLLSLDFTISATHNRMGYHLKELLPNVLEAIITAPVLPGTVQLTPSGTLIVLMRDCQTTGGYPRVLQLSDMAMCVLAQKLTGQTVCFELL
ncbi:biotin-dependent carboxyltransferase family protein [Snuella lapsa]|uniref:Biotin-dependent carboxyltransferase family protein n=2 Tax=Snuella lapsa TaxID=870481 RepID=A0ABP6WM46_9FLAO